MGLSGKICVITGASSGIGRRTALDLAAEGAKVCAAARRQDRLEQLLDEMGASEAGHSYRVVDVADHGQVSELVRHVETTYGRLDVLINNAGMGMEARFTGPESIPDVQRVLQTNFLGAVYCTGEFLPLLTDSAPSSIVNVASMAGRLAPGGIPAYAASKFALVGWSESLLWDLEDLGICVSSIEPGFVPTEGFPQDDLKQDPILRHTLTSVEQVSAAIRDAIRKRKLQRVVPRWYYAMQLPRLLAPPVWQLAMRRLVKPYQRKRRPPGARKEPD